MDLTLPNSENNSVTDVSDASTGKFPTNIFFKVLSVLKTLGLFLANPPGAKR